MAFHPDVSVAESVAAGYLCISFYKTFGKKDQGLCGLYRRSGRIGGSNGERIVGTIGRVCYHAENFPCGRVDSDYAPCLSLHELGPKLLQQRTERQRGSFVVFLCIRTARDREHEKQQ